MSATCDGISCSLKDVEDIIERAAVEREGLVLFIKTYDEPWSAESGETLGLLYIKLRVGNST